MKQIFCSYSTVTPESAEQGDTTDNGWYDNGFKFEVMDKPETGHPCDPDEIDIDEGLTAVDLAVKHLKNKGVVESNGPDSWYSTEYQTEDYGTGEQVQYVFHLEGFTQAERQAIFERMKLR